MREIGGSEPTLLSIVARASSVDAIKRGCGAAALASTMAIEKRAPLALVKDKNR